MAMRRTLIGIALCAFLAGSLGVVAPPSAQAGLISRSEEARMGREAAREFESKNRTSRDRRVEEIGRRLVRATDRQNIEYTFKVVERDEINAVSLPGGYVYVYRGLLRELGDDEDALAGVMAHEIGHITARHSVQQVEKQMGANLLLQLFTSGNTRTLGAIATNLLQLKFGRGDEYEADREAVTYMSRAGYDPRGLGRFFRKLEESEGRGGGSVSWLRSHPSSGERARRVENLAAEFRSGRR